MHSESYTTAKKLEMARVCSQKMQLIALEHHAGGDDGTILHGPTLILHLTHPGSAQRPPVSFPLPPISRGDLRTSCRKNAIPFQTSMPSPGFEPRPYGTSVSVINPYTGWVAISLYY
ncbi:hypothetical protein TNCV_3839821 [Trichonephila clavipes]|nr:hypothetical protein TNCV_3839821 [Trichonephila clavipes]